MVEIDIFKAAHRYEMALKKVKESSISSRNRELVLEFVNDCLIGWGGRKIGKLRAVKYLGYLRTLAEMLEKDFDHIDKRDVKRLLGMIDADPNKGPWSEGDYRIALRKFVSWLREEHGYPSDYPNAEHLTKFLPVMKYPEEVLKLKVAKVNKVKPRDEIPTMEELRFMRAAALNIRDKALFAIWEEVGPRVGGIGSRQLKHVEFDELGALIYMKDKTMKGEPIRLISSASYLRDWIDSHPFKNDPEAPLWVNLLSTGPDPIYYDTILMIVRRAVARHNSRAEKNGLPKITRRIHPHGFRYFAQIRDELDGVPRSVQKKQRGWAPSSNMPDKYAAIVTKDVDEYFAKKFKLNGGKEKAEENITCPRCKDVNFPKSLYCRRCSLPLKDKAKKYDEAIDDIMAKILLDPELSHRLREKLLEVRAGDGA